MVCLTKTEPEPRAGIAYNIKSTGTVLRSRLCQDLRDSLERKPPAVECHGSWWMGWDDLWIGAGDDSARLPQSVQHRASASHRKIHARGPGLLLEIHAQRLDFSTLLNTTIAFPIAWHISKLDGVTRRVSTTNIHGFQAFWTFGHTRARYFPPETGGLIPQGAPLVAGVFRIDHDQAFQSTVNLRYQRKNAEWFAWTWRYDSGLVVSGIPNAGAAMALLTPNQQVTIGLACNGMLAPVDNPISDCVSPSGKQGLVTSKLLTLPQGGYDNFPSQEQDDHNPDRVKSRHLFNLGIGSDNITHREGRTRFTGSFEITNLTNKVALYNFLSTFSGTHFLQPRMFVGRIGLAF